MLDREMGLLLEAGRLIGRSGTVRQLAEALLELVLGGLAADRLLARDAQADMIVMPADHVIAPVAEFERGLIRERT